MSCQCDIYQKAVGLILAHQCNYYRLHNIYYTVGICENPMIGVFLPRWRGIYHLNDNSFFLNSSNCFWYRNLEGPLFPVSFWQDVSCRLNRKRWGCWKAFFTNIVARANLPDCYDETLTGSSNCSDVLQLMANLAGQNPRAIEATCHFLTNVTCHKRSCRDGCETCDFVLCCRSGCCKSICWTQIGTSCLCNAGFWISPTHGRDLSPKASKCACWFIFVIGSAVALYVSDMFWTTTRSFQMI